MSKLNGFEYFELEPSPPKPLESYLVTASINDLNLDSSFAKKMEINKHIHNGQTHQHRRLEEDVTAVRSVDVPVPATPPSHPRMAEKKYWKMSFRIVLLPLLLLGIPAHLPLMKRRVKTRSDWIRGLCNPKNCVVTLLNLIIFLYSVALNVYVLKNAVQMFNILVIRGQLDGQVFLNLVSLFMELPIILPMAFIWIWGYVLRDLILSFSRPSLSDSFLQNPDLFHGALPDLAGRTKLILMYLLIVFIHTMHFYLYSARATKNLPDYLSVLLHFLNYFIGPVFSTLLLPIYATFCWACLRHYTILAHYVQTLISTRICPDVSYFNRFKLAFKELSDRVQLLNKMFSLYFSWVIVNVLMSLYIEAWDFAMVFFMSISKEEPDVRTPATMLTGGNATQMDPRGNATETATAPPDFPPPEAVRAMVGFLFIVFLKLILLAFTYWQAVCVNDMARGLNIWLNDLVTEPDANVSISNYHAFRLLKFYVRSRMQQPRPALLRIPILGCIPVFKARLSPQFVDQY